MNFTPANKTYTDNVMIIIDFGSFFRRDDDYTTSHDPPMQGIKFRALLPPAPAA